VLVVSLSAPIAGLLLFYNPPIPILLLMTCGTVTALLASIGTRNRLEFARRQKNLEDALGAADKVMEESVQAALTSTLLTLGHFLHELSNYQTAISTNLDYIKVKARLSPEVGRALQDAQTAQQEQETLLRRTISDLRSRARPEQGSFQLFSVLSSAAEDTKGLAVTVATPSFDFEVTGNPEHLRVVLLNLLRNAEQANARVAQIDVTLEAKGHQALRRGAWRPHHRQDGPHGWGGVRDAAPWSYGSRCNEHALTRDTQPAGKVGVVTQAPWLSERDRGASALPTRNAWCDLFAAYARSLAFTGSDVV
jgi:signal transduction histidine kinase